MGLNIVAYKHLKEANPMFATTDRTKFWRPKEAMEYSEAYYKGRAEGIRAEAIYTWEDEMHFYAGTYIGYNAWCRYLQQFAKNQAFVELLCFPDNKGVIGTVVAKKLHKDFVKYEVEAKEFAKTFPQGKSWLENYMLWKKAFFYASIGGAVLFT